jgi:hypothetical protein
VFELKHHKGHSGKSVFEWRVYRVSTPNPGRTIRTQLGKYRTKEAAELAINFYRSRA